jgi:hypothetical protein
MNDSFTGGCLCGAVRYECSTAPAMAGHCHCVDCRKASGTGHCSHMMVTKEGVTVTGEVKVYDAPADSGNIVGRAFCPNCGCAVHSVNSAMPDMIFLRASSLDDPEVFKPQFVVYAGRAPSWDYVDPELKTFETIPPEMPV